MASALHNATSGGNKEEVKRLLNSEGIHVNYRDSDGVTLLTTAIKGRNKVWNKVVDLLLKEKDIDVNQADQDGHTPLHIAVLMENCKAVELLLGHEGIQIDLANEYGETPLILASEWGHLEIAKLLLGAGDINVNQADVDGYTPLITAANNGHEEMVALLLGEEKIQVNLADKEGKTPLYCALSLGGDLNYRMIDLIKSKITRPVNKDPICIVCFDRKPDVFLEPCGHHNLCGPCAHQWNEVEKRCPMDRLRIWEIRPLERESENGEEDNSTKHDE